MLAEHHATQAGFIHRTLDSGIVLAVEPLPERATVAMYFRMMTGVADDPPELTGVGALYTASRALSELAET